MRKLIFAMLILTMTGAPAGANSIQDDEDANNTANTAGTQIPRETSTNGYAGDFVLGEQDVDFIGIGPLLVGDMITAMTTPADDDFGTPDTVMGLFNAAGDRLYFNDDLAEIGWGSGLRFEVETDGIYFIAVSGYEDESFEGFHGEAGDYVLTISVASVVIPNRPPECGDVIAEPDELRSPNQRGASGGPALAAILQGMRPRMNRLHAVEIDGATDPDSDPVSLMITSIYQDEQPAQSVGAGGSCGDAEGVGTDTAHLRAQSYANSDGRVYTIDFDASDGNGGECSGSVTVCVPSDRREGNECVDQGPIYNSTECDL